MLRKSPGEAVQGVQLDDQLPTPTYDRKTPQKASKAPFLLKAPRSLEASEQAAVFQYAAIKARTDPRWGMLFAIPNGMAASSIREAVNAKRAGLKRGVPDIFLAVPVDNHAGLFIELKRSGGIPSDVSPEQRDWLQRLQDQGYQTVVAYGWKEAAAEISSYLGDAR